MVVAIASGVGLVLFFSVPIFFSQGDGIGAPTSIEGEPSARGTVAGELDTDVFI